MFNWFKVKPAPLAPISVSMAGVKLGDRVLVVGCGDARLIAALAAKSGLTGRLLAVDESADRIRAAEIVAGREGVLIETATAPSWTLPAKDAEFDLVVVRTPLRTQDRDSSTVILSEARRVLRAGGRCLVIESVPGGGVAGLLRREAASGSPEATAAALASLDFAAVRTLAERDGKAFVEAVKKNR